MLAKQQLSLSTVHLYHSSQNRKYFTAMKKQPKIMNYIYLKGVKISTPEKKHKLYHLNTL